MSTLLESLDHQIKRLRRHLKKNPRDRKIKKQLRLAEHLHREALSRTKGPSEGPFALKITDHAALRFLQRRLDIDLDDVREVMRQEIDVEAVIRLGEGHYPMKNGGKAVVKKDGSVVTYLE